MFNLKNYSIESIVVPVVPQTKPTNVGRVAILDASGSMYSSMPSLKRDLHTWVNALQDGDVVSMAWFSSERGQYDWFIRNMPVGSNRSHLLALIDQKLFARNLTCFSEVLESLPTIIDELSGVGLAVQLSFFTDGYPVVNDQSHEKAATLVALDAVKHKLNNALFVGYRNHNVNLMAEMAKVAGGRLVHANVLSEYLDAKLEMVDGVSNRVPVTIPDGALLVFQIGDNAIEYVPVSVSSNGAALIANADPAKTLYVLYEGASCQLNDVTPIYAAAALLTELAQADKAMDLLAATGDVALIDALDSALTPEDILRVRQEIGHAVFWGVNRYTKGRNFNYAPAPDAVCVLDVINWLMAGENYLSLDEFRYNTIGRKSVSQSSIKFTSDGGQRVPFDAMVWHKSRLNLSVRVRKAGVASFEYGGRNYTVPTYVWRTYTIIADGRLNVDSLPVYLDEPTWVELVQRGVIYEAYNPNVLYHLPLKSLPIMNRLATRPSAVELAELTLREKILEGEQRVLRSLLPETEQVAGESFEAVFGKALADWMAMEGLTERGFNPPSQQVGATDYYFVPTFEIVPKGMKTIPSVASVAKATNLNTPVKKAMRRLLDVGMPEENVAPLLDHVRHELNEVRTAMQPIKFAIVLAKKWPIEFQSYEDRNVTIDDILFEFEFGEEKVMV